MACSTTVVPQDRTLAVTALRLTTVETHVYMGTNHNAHKTQPFDVEHTAKVVLITMYKYSFGLLILNKHIVIAIVLTIALTFFLVQIHMFFLFIVTLFFRRLVWSKKVQDVALLSRPKVSKVQ